MTTMFFLYVAYKILRAVQVFAWKPGVAATLPLAKEHYKIVLTCASGEVCLG